MKRKIIPFKPYTHQCVPGPWRKRGICQLCTEHKLKLEKHIKASRFRGRMRRGIITDKQGE